MKEIREMVSLSSIFDMDNTTRVLLVSSILRNLLSVGIMQNYDIILTWCFLCLFARTCPNINMTEWLPNLWIFWTSCTHRKRTCSNWLTGLRYSKELNFYFPQLFFCSNLWTQSSSVKFVYYRYSWPTTQHVYTVKYREVYLCYGGWPNKSWTTNRFSSWAKFWTS